MQSGSVLLTRPASEMEDGCAITRTLVAGENTNDIATKDIIQPNGKVTKIKVLLNVMNVTSFKCGMYGRKAELELPIMVFAIRHQVRVAGKDEPWSFSFSPSTSYTYFEAKELDFTRYVEPAKTLLY